MSTAHVVDDTRVHVQVKKLADVGDPEDSCVVSAVVCKRNVAHRRMRTQLDSPRVLLLGGALEYQQGAAAKLSTIENLVGTVCAVWLYLHCLSHGCGEASIHPLLSLSLGLLHCCITD
jgi:hypothetical protein